MINLLPKEDKKILLIERNKKITVILCFLLLFFIICLILIFFSIKIYVNGQINTEKTFLAENEKQLFQSELKGLEDKIKIANDSFKKLDYFYSKNIYFSEVLEKISDILPEVFYITNISMKLNVEEIKEEPKNLEGTVRIERKVSINLSGFASTREELLLFKENIEKLFKNVVFPPSNLVSKKNINFYITFDTEI